LPNCLSCLLNVVLKSLPQGGRRMGNIYFWYFWKEKRQCSIPGNGIPICMQVTGKGTHLDAPFKLRENFNYFISHMSRPRLGVSFEPKRDNFPCQVRELAGAAGIVGRRRLL